MTESPQRFGFDLADAFASYGDVASQGRPTSPAPP